LRTSKSDISLLLNAPSRIAAYKSGLEFVGFEKDPTHFKNGVKRYKDYISQRRLF